MSNPPPIQSFGMLNKRKDISPEQFSHHWEKIHGPLGLRTLPVVKRYVQNHHLPGEIPGFNSAPYQGVSETWFDNMQDALNLPNSKEYEEGLKKDEPNFMAGGTGFMMTREREVLPGPEIKQDTSLLKVLFFLKRKPELSLQEFEENWGKVFDRPDSQTGLVRYVQCYILPETYDFSPFDGVAEMWWPDKETFDKSWSQMEGEQMENWRGILDGEASTAMFVREARLLW